MPPIRDIGDSYDEYILDDAKIQEYKKSKRLESIFELPTVISFYAGWLSLVGFLFNIISRPIFALANYLDFPTSLIPLWNSPAPFSEAFNFLIFFSISLVAFIASLRITKIFQKTAQSVGVSEKEIYFDILAEGISEFRDGNIQRAIQQLEEFEETDIDEIPSSMKELLREYLKKVNTNDDSAYLNNTYEDVANIMYTEILNSENECESMLEIIVSPCDSEYFDKRTREIETDSPSPVSYPGIIKKSLTRHQPLNIETNLWIIYLIVAVVSLAVFFLINQTLGMLMAVILLPAWQIYERRKGDSEEGG